VPQPACSPRRGARVLAVDIDEAGLKAFDGVAETYVADVRVEEQVAGYVARAVELFGGIDGLFNNAGIEGSVAPLGEHPVEEFDAVIATNLRGIFLGLTHVLSVLVEGARWSTPPARSGWSAPGHQSRPLVDEVRGRRGLGGDEGVLDECATVVRVTVTEARQISTPSRPASPSCWSPDLLTGEAPAAAGGMPAPAGQLVER
jgi:NAD(P)-dependent dehydrogenase (short-subunit alcohol dehydrogenase family)